MTAVASPPAPVSTARKLEPGKPVRYVATDGKAHEATVLKVHPGNVLDLVIYHGSVPEALAKVPHSTKPPGWHWPDELKLPPTLAETLAAARSSGVRVPRIGDQVVLVQAGMTAGVWGSYGRRSVVTDVFSPRTVALGIFLNPEPPEDSREPDRIGQTRSRVGKGNSAEHWCFPDEFKPGRLPIGQVVAKPLATCGRCGAKVEATRSLHDEHKRHHDDEPATGAMCDDCYQQVIEFARTIPEPAPAD